MSGAVKFVSPTFLRRVHTAARPCGIRRTRVRQNRVVPTVVATVKPVAEVWSAQPGQPHRSSARRGRPEGTRLPGEHGISRQTIAQGRPSDWRHLYAAVRFSCATFRAADRGCEVSTRSSLRPLGQEGGKIKQSSGERSREDAKACLRFEMRTGRAKSSLHTPSLRAQRSNPESFRGGILDCFAALAMTVGSSSPPAGTARCSASGTRERGRAPSPAKYSAIAQPGPMDLPLAIRLNRANRFRARQRCRNIC